jgi:Xaa-Pro aminopeptidase
MAHQLDIDSIRAAVREQALDGWLFFDHHRRDPLAYRILHLEPAQMPTRRWYYFIPANGEPIKLQHRIESGILDALPGRSLAYSSWKEHRASLGTMLNGRRRIAMQYSPSCNVPYVAMVDAGTIELLRELGAEVVSSADLVQVFEARWQGDQLQMHLDAGKRVDAIRRAAFAEIASCLRRGPSVGEIDIRNFILQAFEKDGLFTDHGPIVAVNANASNPHYEPTPAMSSPIRSGDLVLIDLWAKLKQPRAVYYDITWTGYCGASPPAQVERVFEVVAGARDAAIAGAKRAMEEGHIIRGCDIDDLARGFIAKRGLDRYFVHRTGHSIGEDVHGTGANMDNFETQDERRLLPGCCFSVEPGVYLPDFGIRSEVNVFVEERGARVTGEMQTQLLRLLA